MYRRLISDHIIIILSLSLILFTFNKTFPELFFIQIYSLTLITIAVNFSGMLLTQWKLRKKNTEKEKIFIALVINGLKFLIFLILSLVFVKITPPEHHKILAIYLLFLFLFFSAFEIKNSFKNK